LPISIADCRLALGLEVGASIEELAEIALAIGNWQSEIYND
jgi:hypothetical protein